MRRLAASACAVIRSWITCDPDDCAIWKADRPADDKMFVSARIASNSCAAQQAKGSTGKPRKSPATNRRKPTWQNWREGPARSPRQLKHTIRNGFRAQTAPSCSPRPCTLTFDLNFKFRPGPAQTPDTPSTVLSEILPQLPRSRTAPPTRSRNRAMSGKNGPTTVGHTRGLHEEDVEPCRPPAKSGRPAG